MENQTNATTYKLQDIDVKSLCSLMHAKLSKLHDTVIDWVCLTPHAQTNFCSRIIACINTFASADIVNNNLESTIDTAVSLTYFLRQMQSYCAMTLNMQKQLTHVIANLDETINLLNILVERKFVAAGNECKHLYTENVELTAQYNPHTDTHEFATYCRVCGKHLIGI